MANLVKVERMTIEPAKCLACGCGNASEQGPYVDLGVDVNWGDATYLCHACITQLAALAGFVDDEAHEDVKDLVKHKDGVIHDLKAKLEERERRLTAIAEGRKALKQTRKRVKA